MVLFSGIKPFQSSFFHEGVKQVYLTFQARYGRTTVVSTSYVSVAHIADVIIVLHNGEIIEQGTPKELLMSGGAFRYLATLQVIDISAWARNGHMEQKCFTGWQTTQWG